MALVIRVISRVIAMGPYIKVFAYMGVIRNKAELAVDLEFQFYSDPEGEVLH